MLAFFRMEISHYAAVAKSRSLLRKDSIALLHVHCVAASVDAVVETVVNAVVV